MFDILVQYKEILNKSNDLLKDDRGGKGRTSQGSSRGIKNYQPCLRLLLAARNNLKVSFFSYWPQEKKSNSSQTQKRIK